MGEQQGIHVMISAEKVRRRTIMQRKQELGRIKQDPGTLIIKAEQR